MTFASALRLGALRWPAVLLSASAVAQTTGSAPPDKDAIVLSPFEVNTSRDVGFVAASSLAGGRLASDLSDTAVAYSVLTREFLDAVSITDLAEATKWTVNTSSTQDDASNASFARVTTPYQLFYLTPRNFTLTATLRF